MSKFMKRHLAIVFIFLLSVACTSLTSLNQLRYINGASPAADGSIGAALRLFFLNVGQGDSTLIVASPYETMLIDAGPSQAGHDIVLPFLREQGIKKLKYIIATHYHDDHIGGIAEVMKGEDQILGTTDDMIPTNGVIDRGGKYEDSSPAFEEYAKTAGTHRITAYPGDIVALGEASVEVVAANGALEDGTEIPIEPFDENSASLVLLLIQGDFKYLHASDITGGGGDPPYQTIDIETSLAPLVGDIDVLRVAHHGSQTGTNANFLDAVDPEAAIISVGDGNDFGHPHGEIIDRLLEDNVEIYQTEQGWLDERFDDDVHVMNGSITLMTDGDTWSIE